MTVASEIAIYALSDGALACLAPATAALRAGQASVRLPAAYSPDTYEWNATSRTMVASAAKVEAKLIADVKARAEAEKMRVLSSGGAKKTEYADKYREVVAWDTLAGTAAQILIAFNTLSTQQRAVRFAYAIADAAAFGDTPADAIARFKAGIAKSTSAATLAAIEAKACAAIKAATTVAAKQAAAAAVTWPA